MAGERGREGERGGYILNSGSSSLSELKNRRLLLGSLGGAAPALALGLLLLRDPALATLLVEEARDRERGLGGSGWTSGVSPAWGAPSVSTCRHKRGLHH